MLPLVPVSCLMFLFAFPIVTPGQERTDEELESFSIGKNAEAVIIPVTIGGRSYSFLVDSGASFTVFDSSLSSELGNEVERQIISTPAGPREFVLARPKSASIGKLALYKDSPVVLHDLTSMREALGVDIRGCLGMDFLSRHVVRIDLDEGRLTILRSMHTCEGQRLPLKIEGGRPWIEVSVPGSDLPVWFAIDTGHLGLDSGRILADLQQHLEKIGKLRIVSTSNVETAGGRMEIQLGFLNGIKLGPFEHSGWLFSSTRDCNALGLGFLARYNVTFDFPERAVYLRASSRRAATDQLGGSGLGIAYRGGKLVLDLVPEGSPAAKAGQLKNDELQSIDQHKAEGACIMNLGRLLSGTDRTVRISIRRGKEVMEVAVVLNAQWRDSGYGH